jgi:hypothetical protein
MSRQEKTGHSHIYEGNEQIFGNDGKTKSKLQAGSIREMLPFSSYSYVTPSLT